MKGSKQVSLGLVPIIGGLLANCGPSTPTHQQVCADGQNRVVEGQRCVDDEWNRTHQSGYLPLYHYYYMPFRMGAYNVGEVMSGGSYARPGGRVSVATGPVVRGGFGTVGNAGS
jgi:hypothetical protein